MKIRRPLEGSIPRPQLRRFGDWNAGSYPRNRGHEIGSVDLLAAKLRNLAPEPKDDGPIRDLKHDVVEVMRDHNSRVIVLLQFPDQPHHATALLDAQRGGRLVEQHNGGAPP
jgi:hypothetical protein